MPFKPLGPSAPKLVLVEGVEEVGLFAALVKRLGLPGIEINDYGGKSNLAPFLKGLVLGEAFRRSVASLAITPDADDDADNAFRSVFFAAQRAGLQPPAAVGEKGAGSPTVSVFILPGGQRPGALEDLCFDSVRDRPVMECVEQLFACVEKVEHTLPEQKDMSKARLYAYLATRKEPGRRIGETAGKGTWPFDHTAFEPLCRFLESP